MSNDKDKGAGAEDKAEVTATGSETATTESSTARPGTSPAAESRPGRKGGARKGEPKPERTASAPAGGKEEPTVSKTTPTPAKPADTPARAASPARGQSAALLIATLAFLLSLGVGAALFYLWQQGEDVRTDQARQLERLTAELQARDERLGRLDTGLGRETASREELSTRIDTRLGTVEQGLTRLQDRTTRQERGWQLMEVKHLQRMAAHRLRLMDDPDGARRALAAADEILAELGDPRLLPVREAIAAEVQALEDMARPDIPGIALRLERLASELRPIPLKGQVPQDVGLGAEDRGLIAGDGADAEAPWWVQAYSEIRAALAEHISIRRHAEPIRGLPDAEVELFLRQLLTLRLEAARIAVLRRDDAEFQRHLDGATALLDEHFDAAAGAGLRERLQALNGVTLRPEPPDISGSFTLLDELEG